MAFVFRSMNEIHKQIKSNVENLTKVKRTQNGSLHDYRSFVQLSQAASSAFSSLKSDWKRLAELSTLQPITMLDEFAKKQEAEFRSLRSTVGIGFQRKILSLQYCVFVVVDTRINSLNGNTDY